MDDGTCPSPVWNRERLIGQFQQIDASTRGEAERLVADFEQIFRRKIEEPPEYPPDMRTLQARPGK
jgi:hypothetical protein